MVDSTENLANSVPFQFNTNNANNKIIFQNVYHNGFHSLQQVEIKSNTNKTLCIDLKSSLNDQVVFQLTNENLEESHLAKGLATNTAATPLNFSSFNQVFNYVNHMNQIVLKPYEKLDFIIGFLPLINNKENTITDLSNITGIISFKSSNYTLDVVLEATVCQSVLVIDEFDQDLIFDDCIVGQTYVRVITVRNLSAINLYWKLNTSDLVPSNNAHTDSNNHDWLKFVDHYTWNELPDQMESISPLSSYTFKVLFTPREAGKFNYDLQIENINDVNNIIQTNIHATTRNFMHRETLFVTSGNILDFGDCISGYWSKQQMVLKNISESPIELHFTPKNAEIAFNVKTQPDKEALDSSKLLSPELSSSNGSASDVLPSSDMSYVRPISPATSSKTYSSSSHESSTNSIPSTDMDIDMLYNLNAMYLQDNLMLVNSKIPPLLQQTEYTDEENTTKVEDIVLRAGAEKTIIVSYRPVKDEPNSIHAGQFKKQNNFQISIEYRPSKSTQPKETKIIQCKARTCTSFVHVTPQNVDFGQTDVGTQKTFPIQITNLSDICAHVELVFESKVLSCTHGDMLIQPHETVELKLDIFPRKINPTYRRQIKLVNYLNHENDQIIEVSSNNIDEQRVTFHSLYYQIVTPTGANFVDFGQVALHSPAVRTCTIINKKNAPLILALSSPEEILIYTKKKKRKILSTNPSSSSIKEEIKVTDTLIAMNHRTKLTNIQYSNTAYLDLATVPYVRLQRKQIIRQLKIGNSARIKQETITKKTVVVQPQKKEEKYVGITCRILKKTKNINWPDIAGKSRVPLDDLISIVENGSLTRTPLFANPAAEEQFVKYQLAWRTELDRLVERGELVPTTLLQLSPNEDEDIVIVYTPRNEDSQSLTTKKAAAISFRLMNLNDGYAFRPVLRKMIVRAQVIKSSMEVGQRNINFGMVERGEKHHKTIILQNKSETPLLYTIKKSGSIASGDIHLDTGRHGVIRAFGKREIEFVFIPTLPGPFMDQLTISNIRDKEDKTTISLKAVVRRPESFHVKTSSEQLTIGPYCTQTLGTLMETVTVINTHKQSKTFEIRIEPNSYKVDFSILFQTTRDLPEELEEKIEALEQKLKIAITKNKSDKIKKYTKKLNKLRRTGSVSAESRDDEDSLTPEEAEEVDEEDDEALVSEEEQKISQFYKLVDEETMLFTLGPSMSSQISISFNAIQKQINAMAGRILVYEHKNIDTCKTFPFTIMVCADHDVCMANS